MRGVPERRPRARKIEEIYDGRGYDVAVSGDIRSLITMKDVVECVDRTFQGMGDGTVINPPK